MIAMYAQNRDWGLGETTVHVDYDSESTPRRFAIDVQLSGSLSVEQRRRLERVAESCPVRKALEGDFVFEERILASGESDATVTGAATA